MSDARTIDVLNRLLRIHYRSLPMYLAECPPEYGPQGAAAQQALATIVLDRQDTCRRIAEAIQARRGTVETGTYPMSFTDQHLLGIDFLLGPLAERQRQEINQIERSVAELADDREARELAEEALGAARAHLESLAALARQPA